MEKKKVAKRAGGFGQSIGYGIGETGNQMAWYMANQYLTIFYTDVVGLTAVAISLILVIARIWDACNDPMMGMIADRTHTRWGKFRPYIMFAPPFLAVFNVLTFTVFPMQGAMKVIVCLLCYIGLGMTYTICGTAYAGLVNVAAKDSQQRQNMSAARNFFNGIAQLVLGAIVMPMILFFGKSDVATEKGYFMVSIVISLAMLPFYWITAGVCKEHYTEELHVGEGQNHQKRSVFQSLKMIFKNDQLMLVLINFIVGCIGIIGRMSLLAYYVIYVVGSYAAISIIYTVISVGVIIGSALIPFITKRLGKKNAVFLYNILTIVSFLILFAVKTPSVALVAVVSIITGLGTATQGIGFGMVSDCIEYGDWKNGVREEGLSSSFITLGVKLATAICGAGGVLLLAQAGYVPNVEQTEAVKHSISFVINIVPLIFVALSLIPLFFYKLDAKTVAKISQDLEERRVSKKAE